MQLVEEDNGSVCAVCKDVLPDNPHLTPKEFSLIPLIMQGFELPEIARTLCISINTARTHRHNICVKLHAHTGAQLVARVVACWIQLFECEQKERSIRDNNFQGYLLQKLEHPHSRRIPTNTFSQFENCVKEALFSS